MKKTESWKQFQVQLYILSETHFIHNLYVWNITSLPTMPPVSRISLQATQAIVHHNPLSISWKKCNKKQIWGQYPSLISLLNFSEFFSLLLNSALLKCWLWNAVTREKKNLWNLQKKTVSQWKEVSFKENISNFLTNFLFFNGYTQLLFIEINSYFNSYISWFYRWNL